MVRVDVVSVLVLGVADERGSPLRRNGVVGAAVARKRRAVGRNGEIGVFERLVGVRVWMGVVDVDGVANRTYKLGEEGGVLCFRVSCS